MASMQRQPSQNRPTASRTPTHEPAHSSISQTQALPSATGVPDAIDSTETMREDQAVAPSPPRFTSADDDPSVKKCWICFSDSTEDTAETSPWRDPCPCALVAHEECLLDWIADTEVHKTTARGGILAAPQILCPQCKGEIKLARPRSYVVDLVKFFDRTTSRLIMPGGVIVLSSDILVRLTVMHGVNSIYRIFGAADANRILWPLILGESRSRISFNQPVSVIGDRLLESMIFRAQHWRLYLGLPLITPMLLLSRTNWHISEAFLTITPTIFFALQTKQPGEVFRFGQWPPSASMAFALLPYFRQAYNLYYERIWGHRIRKWKREILPTVSQAQADAAEHDPLRAIEEAADDTNVFEIRVDTGIWEDWEDGAQPANAAPPAAAGADADVDVAQANDDAAPAPVVRDNRNQAPAAPPPPARQQDANGERRLSFSPVEVAANVLGALAFPTIAELSGDILRRVLPQTWTTQASNTNWTAARAVSKGILHEKWGRSLIGGCLFVVLKDALMIYVRWKMAQMHRNRRVLDFDRSKAKAKAKS